MAKPALRIKSPSPPDGDTAERMDWTPANRVRPERVSWLLPRRIPRNGITLLEGHMSSGKSTLLAHLVAVVTRGRAWLGRPRGKAGNVLWLAAEEDIGSDVVPRLHAAGADLSRCHFAPEGEHGVRFQVRVPGHLGILREAIASLSLSLLILDPFVSHIASDVDLHSETAVRAVLDPLHALAASTKCAIIGTRHLRKDASGPRIHHGLGSVAVGSTARAILQIDRQEGSTVRVLRAVKVARGGQVPSPVQFEIGGDEEEPILIGVRELSPADDDPLSQEIDHVERSALEDAVLLLRRSLKTGWVNYRALLAEAQSAGVAERTLRRASVALRVRHRRIGTSTPPYWEWALPTPP